MENTLSELDSFSDTIKSAIPIYKNKFWTLVGIAVIPTLVFSIITLIIALFFSLMPMIAAMSLAVVFFLAGILISLISQIAMIFAVVSESNITSSFRLALGKISSYAWIYVLIIFASVGGLALGIVPGIIISVWAIFSMYVLILEDKKGMSAIIRSREYVKGYWFKLVWKMFVLLLVIGVVILASSLVFSIFGEAIGGFLSNVVSIIIGPFVTVFIWILLNQIKSRRPELESSPVGSENKKLIVVSAIIGTVAVPALLLFFLFLA
jgi:hypothetical protein